MRSAASAAALGLALVLLGCGGHAPEEEETPMAAAGSLVLSSPAFADGQSIPAVYTCDGPGRSPPLSWSGAPPGTQSFVLIMDDPDAPRGTWDHWLVWNLHGSALADGTDGGGASGTNSWDKTGYGGPCPPSGTHRYVFRLLALDTQLDLPASTRKAALLAATKGHVLAEARLMGRYCRG
jgi:Raf kinase inhibitor-like YbhB/YbcL family protein